MEVTAVKHLSYHSAPIRIKSNFEKIEMELTDLQTKYEELKNKVEQLGRFL